MYTSEQNALIEAFFCLSIAVSHCSVLQDYSTHMYTGHNVVHYRLYRCQLSCRVNGANTNVCRYNADLSKMLSDKGGVN